MHMKPSIIRNFLNNSLIGIVSKHSNNYSYFQSPLYIVLISPIISEFLTKSQLPVWTVYAEKICIPSVSDVKCDTSFAFEMVMFQIIKNFIQYWQPNKHNLTRITARIYCNSNGLNCTSLKLLLCLKQLLQLASNCQKSSFFQLHLVRLAQILHNSSACLLSFCYTELSMMFIIRCQLHSWKLLRKEMLQPEILQSAGLNAGMKQGSSAGNRAIINQETIQFTVYNNT